MQKQKQGTVFVVAQRAIYKMRSLDMMTVGAYIYIYRERERVGMQGPEYFRADIFKSRVAGRCLYIAGGRGG